MGEGSSTDSISGLSMTAVNRKLAAFLVSETIIVHPNGGLLASNGRHDNNGVGIANITSLYLSLARCSYHS